MKRLLWLSVFFTLASVAWGQATPAVDSDRLFLPRNFIWGYTQFDIAPPHNEPDPNICAANAREFGGASAPCNAFARYMLWGYVEVRPFARTPLRRLLFFGEPRFLFGKNVPQALYTWSMAGIGWERSWGAGIEVGHGFEVRVTQHFLFQRFGSRDRYLGPADLGVNGPWGRYNVIGVRKYFGYRKEGE
ncbi:MAG TPA: hypothetical protein VEV41_26155 [Terriglobales bacterium]|nr:hypothetical protein [Terriglobales bacterium]